jgi:hypothetical protein
MNIRKTFPRDSSAPDHNIGGVIAAHGIKGNDHAFTQS